VTDGASTSAPALPSAEATSVPHDVVLRLARALGVGPGSWLGGALVERLLGVVLG
jgi:hypothetical protein